MSSAQEMEQAELQPRGRDGSSATVLGDESGLGCSFEPLCCFAWSGDSYPSALRGTVLGLDPSMLLSPSPVEKSRCGAVGSGHSGCV